MSEQPRVAIVGGGLAGLAAAVALRSHGLQIDLFEVRSRLGGRASSFRDAQSGQLIDYCQHVSMGCCTNLADFCRRVGIQEHYQRENCLHFFDQQGRRYDVAASRWLPAPFHLGPSLWRLRYLSFGERLRIAWVVWKLIHYREPTERPEPDMDVWLRQSCQSDRAIEQFWGVILISALGESLDRIAVSAARKVIVDGFLASADAYEVVIPERPLGELYGQLLEEKLSQEGVQINLAVHVHKIDSTDQRYTLTTSQGPSQPYSHVVTALPWRQSARLLGEERLSKIPKLREAAQFDSSPITGIHLWFDRTICDVPHAVLVGRMSHWLFARGHNSIPGQANRQGQYYQVVISASRDLAGRDHQDVADQVCHELRSTFDQARDAQLLHARVVTEKAAVFSPLPGTMKQRPSQISGIPGLYLSGDWTDTGWPATMEGAVRSGYLAAEALLRDLAIPAKLLVPELPRGALTRLLIGKL